MRKRGEAILFVFGIFLVIILGITKIARIILSAIADSIVYNQNPLLLFISIGVGIILAYQIFILLYFKNNRFKNLKDSIKEHIISCNDLNHYIQELKCSYVNIKSYDFGQSSMADTSNYKFKRKEWNKSIKSNQIHLCSASVCNQANNQPIKYFCKYFNVEKNEGTLSNFEKVLNDYISVDQGKFLLKKERDAILKGISKSIPPMVLFFSKDRLIRKLGFEVIDFSDSYIPVFTFQYVSPGGNSSSKCDIKLDIENLNKVIIYLNDVIKWRKSIAGQRALMTSKLREKIKRRDKFTCCNCNLSIKDEQNLLLEIDHIIPISKGGLTFENNLQTLCWRCNRAKGSKTEKRVEQWF